MRYPLLLLLWVVLLISACRKDSFITSPNALVEFSTDTLLFDTVFVATGSVTQSVTIVNDNSQKLHLSSVRLMGGAQSFFHINIDGTAGPAAADIDLGAGDSLYVFVAVKIDPRSATLPFVVQDSIQVQYNGKTEYIQLEAWGQNAHFLRNQVINANTVWNNDLPYVILGGLQIDSNASLTISAGCKVYFHADAPLLVDGTLLVNGDHYDSTRVYFRGDRLDQPYSDFPGSWPGIYFRGSSIGNHLRYADILNAYQAVVAASPPAGTTPKVLLEQCIIDNSYNAGIIGLQGSLSASNCLISNCGSNIQLGGGGFYQFAQCTAAAYSNNYISHTQPVLSIADVVQQGNSVLTGGLQASFTNCIFWGANGSVNDEVVVNRAGTNTFNINFSNCLWKVKTAPTSVTVTGIIANQDPLFDSVNNFAPYYDFHIRTGSPAIGAGISTGIGFDLDGNPRPAMNPDLGCYQRQ